MRSLRAAVLSFSILAVAGALAARDAAPVGVGAVRVIASIDGTRRPEDVAARLQAKGYAVDRILEDLHAIEATGVGRDASAVAAGAASVGGVAYAEPVVHVMADDSPSDPLFARQSSYLTPVTALQAWDITKGAPDIVVAVVDTGVDVRHPDLINNIWVNPREVANNGVDDDGNGCVDDVNGCALVSDSSPGCQNVTNGLIRDDIGHGTFVAGIIAAAANNTGMVGVARGVRIMPVKALDCFGAGDSVATARGITYAARNGARVINLSLGGLESAQVVTDAVAEAESLGAVVVAAAGNSGTAGVSFPARLPNVLAVGAAAQGGGDIRAPFSSYGPEIDVEAIGASIIGTVPASRCNLLLPCMQEGPYGSGSGTSFSAPQASGLAALMLSLKRDLSPVQVMDIIKATATAVPAGTAPNWAGSGRLNMVAALRAVLSNQPAGEACVVQSVTDGESFTCAGGRKVRMLQMDAPNPGQCGADWAKAAAQYIFLPPGRTVYLRYDSARTDAAGNTLAAPIWRGNDGGDYNLGITMVFVGLARASDVGPGNQQYHDWAFASEHWANVALWNMWAPGKPFTGGC